MDLAWVLSGGGRGGVFGWSVPRDQARSARDERIDKVADRCRNLSARRPAVRKRVWVSAKSCRVSLLRCIEDRSAPILGMRKRLPNNDITPFRVGQGRIHLLTILDNKTNVTYLTRGGRTFDLGQIQDAHRLEFTLEFMRNFWRCPSR